MGSLHKRLKEKCEQFRWNPWPLIADRDRCPRSIRTLFLGNDYLDGGLGGRGGDGIRQQIVQHLLDAVTVDADDDKFVGGLHLDGVLWGTPARNYLLEQIH